MASSASAYDLTAGQTLKVGTVTVTNDADNIYVNYNLTYPGATFGTLHAWVGNDISLVPANRQGTPVPGQFCNADGGACYDASGLTDYTFTFPFPSAFASSGVSMVDAYAACGSMLYTFTHAEVNIDNNGDGTADQHETAFGGGTPVNVGEPGRWYFYDTYAINCDFGPPPQCFNETAFAKGTHVWTTAGKKSNPENLPSLELTKNKWGWAINRKTTGTTTHDLWAGAGLNKTSNGTRVGALTLNWDGYNATMSFTMLPGFYMDEIHLYAGDNKPATTAPGQYGNPTEGYDAGNTQSFSYTINDVQDTNGDGAWFIGHAVITNGACNPQ